jgi:hypothetical protein
MRRKNPYYGEPISLTVVGLGVLAGSLGLGAGLSLGTYKNIRENINLIQNYDGVAELLHQSIKGLREGALSYEDVRIRPSLMVTAPTNVRQAFLQSGWYVMQAASQVEGRERLDLLNVAEQFWDDSESASKDIVAVGDPSNLQPSKCKG